MILREGLSADGMSLTIPCGGQSKVGIGITGTWAGTVKFYSSNDGQSFRPLSVTPFPSGTTVQSATANGSWEVSPGSASYVKATFTRTSGTAVVQMAASIDASYQAAFVASTARFVNSIATNATNTITQAAQANRAWRLRKLVVSVSAAATWAAKPVLKITDGASTILWAVDVPVTAGIYDIPLPLDPGIPGEQGGGIVGTVGNSMVITLQAAGSGIDTEMNAEFGIG